ncbi:MAG TPA: FAD-dependent oxidoreductase, partial [Solirubrobacterales bacterium]|nr:FAD-dependent oxidoreductase [Solirubrobacterales bacterium]
MTADVNGMGDDRSRLDREPGQADREIRADILVIGFGKGGKTVAAEMGRRGKRVVIVERSERMYGGTCPNVGCVPSKGLVHRSRLRRPDDPAQEFYAQAVAEVQEIREFMRRGNFDGMEAMETVTVLTGPARFLDPYTVEVELGGERARVSAERVLINSGSEPRIPDIPGLATSKRAITSTALIESTRLPGRLAILGGGYLGIEFAAMYQAFGSQVQLIETAPRLLPNEDDDVAAAAIEILEGEGIEIVTGAEVTAVRDEDGAAVLSLNRDGEEVEVSADTILVAAGRVPVTGDLGLEAAGVDTDARGAIKVDEHLLTSQPHIHALGDVNGGPQFTYVSLDDARIVLDQLLGDGRRSLADRRAVPHTLFITPPLATVGMTEAAAREAGLQVKIGSEPVADILAMPRAYAVAETRGMMKFVVDAETDQIL